MPKDLFSEHAGTYSAFRPRYPQNLYQFIYQHTRNFEAAWDCATGNGQVASELAKQFKKVEATDISQAQMDQADLQSNVAYTVCAAEKTSFPDHCFDLITVAQALHWFELDQFFGEVSRVMRPGGILAVWGYSILTINPAIDRLFLSYYNDVVGPYWDPARHLIEDEYKSIQFPFEELHAPNFTLVVSWSRSHFLGYLASWSATQKYMKANGKNPLEDFLQELQALWKDETSLDVTFPLFLRLFKI